MPHSLTIGTGVGTWLPPFFVCYRAPPRPYNGGMAYPYHAPQTTLTSVTASTVSVLLSTNVNRKGVTVYNDSTATLYLALADVASTTAFTCKVFPGHYFECPYGYSGPVSGLWSSANGAARVTEVF